MIYYYSVLCTTIFKRWIDVHVHLISTLTLLTYNPRPLVQISDTGLYIFFPVINMNI